MNNTLQGKYKCCGIVLFRCKIRVMSSSSVAVALLQQHHYLPFQEVFERPITLSLCLIMTATHMMVHSSPQRETFLLGGGLRAYSVVKHRQWHRLATHAFLHADLKHLFCNMLTLLQWGPLLEHRLGSVKFGLTVAAGTLLSSSVHVLLENAIITRCLRKSRDNTINFSLGFSERISLGFSGVLFHLIVVEIASRKLPVKRTLGLTFAMMAANQAPGVSFIGHLSGVLSGMTQVVAMNVWKHGILYR